MAILTYLSFVQDPDQASRRQELTAFFGPNAAAFLSTYDRMHAIANRPKGEKPSFRLNQFGFCVPALFLGPVWLFYRKMWLWGAVMIVAGVLFGVVHLPTGASIGLSVAVAGFGRQLYVTHAISVINKLRSVGASTQQLASAGGVAMAAAVVSGVLLTAVVALGIYLQPKPSLYVPADNIPSSVSSQH